MTYGSRMLAAFIIGTVAGCIMAVVMTFFLLLGGTDQGHEGLQISIASAAAVSVLGGVAAGFVVGVLQKLSKTMWGAALLGTLALLPWTVGLWMLYGSPLGQGSVTAMVMTCVLIGGGLGAYFGQSQR